MKREGIYNNIYNARKKQFEIEGMLPDKASRKANREAVKFTWKYYNEQFIKKKI